MMPTLTEKEINEIKSKRIIRTALARENHYWFMMLYLGHHFKYPFAPFHYEVLKVTENNDIHLAVMVAFRGSGKSTIMSLSYPIWAIIGKLKKKFVLISCQTQNQARQFLANIKDELMNNELLKADIGPFEEESDQWGAYSIVLPKFKARVTAVSAEQSIRGLKHLEYRPDLVICDDVEDSNSVRTREGRDKTFQWFSDEVIPIGDNGSKIIVVGNLLHEDSLIMKLKKSIDEQKLDAEFMAVPLLNNKQEIAWLGKYPTMVDIEKLKRSVPSESAFLREYLLTIIPDEGRIVHSDWIKYYHDVSIESEKDFRYAVISVDPAISEKESADYTGIITAYIFGYGDETKIYLLPHPINQRMDFPTTINKIKELHQSFTEQGIVTKVFVEDVGYQKSLIQQLKSSGLDVSPITIHGDKKSRLTQTTSWIKIEKIFFCDFGSDILISQLIGFGIEKHDDVADAFSLLVLKIIDTETDTDASRFLKGIKDWK